MLNKQHFDVYSTLTESKPELYTSIEVRGVKGEFNSETNELDCETDDDNPQFFSAYVRETENGCAYCIVDAGMSKLDELRAFAKDLADQYDWEYQDFTIDKSYQSTVS